MGNQLVGSKLAVGHLHLVCRDNAWRLPPWAVGHAMAERRAGTFRGEQFGTRHDAGRDATARPLLRDEPADSTQMIYDFEVILPGSAFWGGVHWQDLTVPELAALRSAWDAMAVDRTGTGDPIWQVGAKAAVGHGRMAIHAVVDARAALSPPTFSPAEAIMPAASPDHDALAAYVDHLRSNREAILACLQAL